MANPLLLDADRVVTAYPAAITTARWTPLGSAGGFSGARLWRGVAADGRAFALKAHPPGANAGRLQTTIHRWMELARRAGLDFVPAVERTGTGRTVVESGGRAWDVTSWMPGAADFRKDSTDAKLFAAVAAVARVHEAWADERSMAPCPAVARRQQVLLAWAELLADGWRPRFEPDDPVRPAAEAAWALLPAAVNAVRPAIAYWLERPVPVQPCLCDVWHDHVLFQGERVTGLIDYAAAKADHVAVDLARLLGSLVPDDPARTEAAIRGYVAIRPMPDPDLVGILDRTGTVVAVANWLRWLYHDGRKYADRNAVAERVAGLVQRLTGVLDLSGFGAAGLPLQPRGRAE